MKHLFTITILFLFTGILRSQAQVDTINVSSHKLITAQLKPGLRQYLVYFQRADRHKSLLLTLWTRNIKLEQFNGEQVFKTEQHWYGSDTATYRAITSINRKSDFAPLYHSESIGGKLKAYNWGPKQVAGADTVKENLAKDFKLNFEVPNLNWNLDIETFEMLPLAKGKIFAINFYDAGLTPPAYVNYKVTGDEIITLLDNQKVDCWKLSTEGKSPNGTTYTETYWISKKNHEFLKEEDNFNGMYRYKIKLSGAAPDLLTRFK
ncbi:DUF3108 domain-containing protein [Mucilaginibacter sp. KACC 22063]|uniref:DUF3108 domain-containing protein n=1 Tax=Mucilaginibacter sp. KACC 22063 TaxID=3025666 RepID=UPI002364FE52|nr:hypothetical protein [Mucilaginibacter sp. KACC 22063]WDF56083.1 hypothetical protein PQ461_03285 [Mucilaginibacter sp. KACC 22063]